MKTVEGTSLKFCTILKLVILHSKKTTAQVFQCACENLSSIKRRSGNSFHLLQKAEILVVVTLDHFLSESMQLFKDLFK